RFASQTSAPLPSRAAVLNAVRSNGSRGWAAGGHVPGGTELRVIRYAERNPANSMTSVNRNTAIPNSAWSVNPRRGTERMTCSSGLAMLRLLRRGVRPGPVLAGLVRLRGREAVVEARVLLPALARALLHVRRERAV